MELCTKHKNAKLNNKHIKTVKKDFCFYFDVDSVDTTLTVLFCYTNDTVFDMTLEQPGARSKSGLKQPYIYS